MSKDNSNDIHTYDPIKDSWTTKSLPFKIKEFTMQTYEGKIYLIGGHDGLNLLDDINIYNPDTNEWSKGKKMSMKRANSTSITHGNKIYVIGGRELKSDSKVEESSAAVEVYDTKEDCWSRLKSLPLGRRAPSSAFIGDRLYIFGGRNQETVDFMDSVISLKIGEESIPETEDLQVLLFLG